MGDINLQDAGLSVYGNVTPELIAWAMSLAPFSGPWPVASQPLGDGRSLVIPDLVTCPLCRAVVMGSDEDKGQHAGWHMAVRSR